MTVEITFSLTAKLPELSQQTVFGSETPPTLSVDSPDPDDIVLEMGNGWMRVRLDGINASDLSTESETAIVDAVEASLPIASHISTRDRSE